MCLEKDIWKQFRKRCGECQLEVHLCLTRWGMCEWTRRNTPHWTIQFNVFHEFRSEMYTHAANILHYFTTPQNENSYRLHPFKNLDVKARGVSRKNDPVGGRTERTLNFPLSRMIIFDTPTNSLELHHHAAFWQGTRKEATSTSKILYSSFLKEHCRQHNQ